MKKYVVPLLVLASAPAWAQQPAAPTVQDQTFAMKLSVGELTYIVGVLQERPYKEAAPIIADLKTQYEAQAMPKVEPPKPAPKAEEKK